MHNFGDENKTFITNHEFRGIIISHFRGIVRLINLIYFNPKFPENQTIRYNPNDQVCLYVYNEGIFQPLIKEYVLDTIIIDAWSRLVKYFEMIESTGRRDAFRNTLASTETLERIDAFLYDYQKLCRGIVPSMLKDIRHDVLELFKFHYHETEKKKKKRCSRNVRLQENTS